MFRTACSASEECSNQKISLVRIVTEYLSNSLPLLEHINERAVCNAIAPEKDVDGFHIVNIGKLCLDQRSMVPATPAAVWEIIKRAGKLTKPLPVPKT